MVDREKRDRRDAYRATTHDLNFDAENPIGSSARSRARAIRCIWSVARRECDAVRVGVRAGPGRKR